MVHPVTIVLALGYGIFVMGDTPLFAFGKYGYDSYKASQTPDGYTLPMYSIGVDYYC